MHTCLFSPSNSRGLWSQTRADVLYGSSVAVIAVFMVLEFMLYCIHTVRVPAPGRTQVDLVAFIVFSHLSSDAQISVRGHIR